MESTSNTYFRLGHSSATDARQAAREFFASVEQDDMSAVVFFCASDYDLDILRDELNLLFGDILLLGCTTAGEFGPAGYRNHTISGVSFSSRVGTIVADCLPDLKNFDSAQGQAFASRLLQQRTQHLPQETLPNTFAFLLIDGLSGREEPVARALQAALGCIHLIGGSAGDGLRFSSTQVFYGGEFRSDSAVLLVVSTQLPIRVFKTEHLKPGNKRLVVTAADAEQRLVQEINGLPAAEEYARLLGITVDELTPAIFSQAPLVVLIEGTPYVRAIQKANPDGSLKFYCAIETGLVLRIAHADDMYENLATTFELLHKELGRPALVLGCDCILRNLEMSQTELTAQIGSLFSENNTVGFSTYGEQFGGVHINQTFTGIAIGSPDKGRG